MNKNGKFKLISIFKRKENQNDNINNNEIKKSKVRQQFEELCNIIKSKLTNLKIFSVNNSLRLRMTLIMTMIVVSIVLLCWGTNRAFLSEYYTHTKIDQLEEEYKNINKDFDEKGLSKFRQANEDGSISEIDTIINSIESRGNLNSTEVYVLDSYSLGNQIQFKSLYPVALASRTREMVESKITAYFAVDYYDTDSVLVTMNDYKVSKLESYEKYSIYKTYDERLKSSSIELFGQLDSGVYVIISSNFESMKESVTLANNFLAYIGLSITILASILVFFISKSVTKPILDISNIAQRMANLDFEAKYNVTNQDEIAVLGKSINTLSEKLKNTISELKLANAELLNDIENKEKTDNMRKEFLSNVSHELKTPIALIQGYAEGLKDNINDDEESRDFYCEVIVDEAKKMNNMVMKLLDLNHIEFGDSPMSMERFDICELINAVLSSTEILFNQKEAKVIFNNESPIYVWADSYMIEEVITNYISNALNHVAGEKVIEIKLIEREDVVRVAVYNTGSFIPEEDINRIWEKFYKVDKARTREYGGSGVGLSIVKAILDCHGRDCGAVNRENGVEFWFELDTKA